MISSERLTHRGAFTLISICTAVLLLDVGSATVVAQTADSQTRQAAIEQAQSQKVPTLQPYSLSKGERFMTKIEDATLYRPGSSSRKNASPSLSRRSRG